MCPLPDMAGSSFRLLWEVLVSTPWIIELHDVCLWLQIGNLQTIYMPKNSGHEMGLQIQVIMKGWLRSEAQIISLNWKAGLWENYNSAEVVRLRLTVITGTALSSQTGQIDMTYSFPDLLLSFSNLLFDFRPIWAFLLYTIFIEAYLYINDHIYHKCNRFFCKKNYE